MWWEKLVAPSDPVQGRMPTPLELWLLIQAPSELVQAQLEQGEEGRLQAPLELAKAWLTQVEGQSQEELWVWGPSFGRREWQLGVAQRARWELGETWESWVLDGRGLQGGLGH
jgi:hypothetical protein